MVKLDRIQDKICAVCCWPNNSTMDSKTAKRFRCQMSRVQWVRSLTRPSVTCDKAAPYLPRAVRSPQGVPAFLQHQGTSCCCSCWPKSSFGYFHKVVWEHANELFGQPKSLQLQQVKLLLFFFFFFHSRYCMEFKTESLTHHCALENRPLTRWMQYLREGYTVCVDCQPPAMNSVSLRCSGDGLDSDG